MSSNVFNLIALDPKAAASSASSIALMAMIQSGSAAVTFMNSMMGSLISLSKSALFNAWIGGAQRLTGEGMNAAGQLGSAGTEIKKAYDGSQMNKEIEKAGKPFEAQKETARNQIKGVETDLNTMENRAGAGDLRAEFAADSPVRAEKKDTLKTRYKGLGGKMEDLESSQKRAEDKIRTKYDGKNQKTGALGTIFGLGGRLGQAAMQMAQDVTNGLSTNAANLLQTAQTTYRDMSNYAHSIAGFNFYSQLA